MGTIKTYTGLRYVPLILGDWDNTMQTTYEALSVVMYGGNSYTSKKTVPLDIAITNTVYWALTGNYNVQVEQYRTEVEAYSLDVVENTNKIAVLESDNTTNKSDIDSLQISMNKVDNYNQYLFGKRVLIIGDSLSDETTNAPNWVAKFKTDFSNICTSIQNESIGGIGLCGTEGMANLVNNITGDFDIIIVELGTNDCNNQFPIGLSTDSTIGTFYGALNVFKTNVQSRWDTASVFYVSPLKNTINKTNGFKLILDLYRLAICDFCNHNNWMFINASDELPNLNPDNDYYKTLYMTDGIHPNTNYAQTFCDYLITKMVCFGHNNLSLNSTIIGLTVNSAIVSDGSVNMIFKTDGTLILQIAVNFVSAQNGTVKIADNLQAYGFSISPTGQFDGLNFALGVYDTEIVVNTLGNSLTSLIFEHTTNVKWLTKRTYSL